MSKNFTVIKGILRDPDRTHAVLLAGHEGSEVMHFAQQLAKGWLCPSATPPCGECQACRSLESGTCVDFQMIEPTGASRNILLGAIVPLDGEDPETIPLSQFLRTSPLASRRKVVIIKDADRMNSRACNALLKMLEEPTKFGKFILTTGSVSRLPTTIVSRCMSILCPLPDQATLNERFGHLSEVECLFGEGALERVALIREQSESFEQLERTFGDLKSSPRGAALKCAEQLRSHGESLGEKLGVGTRQGNAEVLRALGRWWLSQETPDSGELASIAESHRAVLGNGSAPAIFDALVTYLMRNRELSPGSGSYQ